MTLVNFATNPRISRGRLFADKESSSLLPFEVDLSRIIKSVSFRRMQYKTQVFMNFFGDHYRTRLTHSLEVSDIARNISSKLKISKDLAVIISLIHDIGHPPFGHAGEDILNEKMKDYGGFNHNDHAMKILTELEDGFIGFNGLNLSWEVLEGLAKHNGPVIGENNYYYKSKTLPKYIIDYSNNKFDLELYNYSGIEAQVAALADDIAYNNHDIEDGIRANLFSFDDLLSIDFIKVIYEQQKLEYQNTDKKRLIRGIIRELTNQMTQDVISNTNLNIRDLNIKSPEEVRAAKVIIANFSALWEEKNNQLKKFLFEHMYDHPKVRNMTDIGKKVINNLFDFYLANTNEIPSEWRKEGQPIQQIICDYIACMTDRFAVKKYNEYIDTELIDINQIC